MNPPSEVGFQKFGKGHKPIKAFGPWSELDEDIDIALRTSLTTHHGAVDGQSGNSEGSYFSLDVADDLESIVFGERHHTGQFIVFTA